jgi:hypothetical protein
MGFVAAGHKPQSLCLEAQRAEASTASDALATPSITGSRGFPKPGGQIGHAGTAEHDHFGVVLLFR